jgi:hypothetical protein
MANALREQLRTRTPLPEARPPFSGGAEGEHLLNTPEAIIDAARRYMAENPDIVTEAKAMREQALATPRGNKLPATEPPVAAPKAKKPPALVKKTVLFDAEGKPVVTDMVPKPPVHYGYAPQQTGMKDLEITRKLLEALAARNK